MTNQSSNPKTTHPQRRIALLTLAFSFITLAVFYAPTAGALIAPKTTKVNGKTLYIKSCEVVGVDSQSCMLCTDEELKDCKEYLCDRMNPPSCTAMSKRNPGKIPGRAPINGKKKA